MKYFRGNIGISRLLRKLNNKIQPKGTSFVNSIISVLALVISISSLYFQFFYQKYSLSSSIIDANVFRDSINIEIIYQNSGNIDATILEHELFFYNKSFKDSEDFHLQFKNKEFIPFIISPNSQRYFIYSQSTYFNEENLLNEYMMDGSDTIMLGLRTSFLNSNLMQSDLESELGWITLDSLKKIEFWVVEYQKISLESDYYYSRGYKLPR